VVDGPRLDLRLVNLRQYVRHTSADDLVSDQAEHVQHDELEAQDRVGRA